MKVSGPSGASPANGARPVRAPALGGGFTVATAPSAGETAGARGATGVAGVGSLEALIALQEVGGPLERRRRAVGRAGSILDALENLKIDLLGNQLDGAGVERLARTVREQRALTDDPGLEGVLDEIETRAAVELAKIEIGKARA
jgi:hypothetical protein